VAARHVAEQKMVLLDRNWRCDEGELDLVLRDGPALVP
jgi:putative endonuclease